MFPNGVGNVETHSNIYNRIFKPLMLKCGIIDGEGAPRFSLASLKASREPDAAAGAIHAMYRVLVGPISAWLDIHLRLVLLSPLRRTFSLAVLSLDLLAQLLAAARISRLALAKGALVFRFGLALARDPCRIVDLFDD